LEALSSVPERGFLTRNGSEGDCGLNKETSQWVCGAAAANVAVVRLRNFRLTPASLKPQRAQVKLHQKT